MNPTKWLVTLLGLIPTLAFAGPRGGVITEAPVTGSGEALSPAVQAAPYQTMYGMADQHRYQFNLGSKVTVDTLRSRPYYKTPGSEEITGVAQSRSAVAADSLPIEEEPIVTADSFDSAQDKSKAEAVAPKRRSLVDAPFSPPLPAAAKLPPGPATHTAGPKVPLSRAMMAAPSEIGATVLTPSGPASRRAIDNLKRPAVFSPGELPALTGEGAAAVGQADYGRRVLGETGHAPIAIPSHGAPPSAQTYPLPVVVEIKLNAEKAMTPQAAVTALQDGTGLFIDPSFPVLMSSSHRNTAFVRGWVNSDKLMHLTLDPVVVRVSVAGSAAPAPAERLLEVPVVLHLSLPKEEAVSSFIGRSVAGLESQAGFKWRVSRGYQLFRSATGGTVVLTGELPISSVDRLLAYPDLLRVEPFVAPVEAKAAPQAPVRAPRRAPSTVKKAVDLTILSTAFPWMGILIREIYFWIQIALT